MASEVRPIQEFTIFLCCNRRVRRNSASVVEQKQDFEKQLQSMKCWNGEPLGLEL